MIAFSRPFWPLFLHVLGAMTLFGAILTAVVLAYAHRAASTFTTLLIAIPCWAVAFAGGIWIDSKEDLPSDPAWLGIGHITLEGGLIVLLLPSIGCAYWWKRSGKPVAGRIVAGLATVYLLLLTVAMLAMSGKWG
jgi:hypothetical protein